MITNPEEQQCSNNNNEYAMAKDRGASMMSATGSSDSTQEDIPENPFENQHMFKEEEGHMFKDEFEMPQPVDQQQQQQQQYYQYNNYHQQQHQQQWHQQQYQQQQQQHMYNNQMDQHHQMYHAHHGYHYNQHHQQQMYPGMYHHNGSAVNTTSPPNATPSPTTNSDDSGGDCVNESKRIMAAVGATGPTVVPPPPAPHHLEHGTGQHGSMGHHYYHSGRGVPLVQKRPRQSRRGKKKRDPNEPQKPVSAYALFFRDMQAGIKARNPNASFGEVSKHVASMWDSLNPDHKAAYKKRTENAKKEYLKQLAAYRANLVSKNPNDPYAQYSSIASYYKTGATAQGYEYQRDKIVPPGGPGYEYPPRESPKMGAPGGYDYPHQRGPTPSDPERNQNYLMHSQYNPTATGPPTPSPSGVTPSHPGGYGGPDPTGNGLPPNEDRPKATPPNCRRPGCSNPIMDFTMNGYCSNDCVLSQSREVYNSWSANGSTTSTTAPTSTMASTPASTATSASASAANPCQAR